MKRTISPFSWLIQLALFLGLSLLTSCQVKDAQKPAESFYQLFGGRALKGQSVSLNLLKSQNELFAYVSPLKSLPPQWMEGSFDGKTGYTVSSTLDSPKISLSLKLSVDGRALKADKPDASLWGNRLSFKLERERGVSLKTVTYRGITPKALAYEIVLCEPDSVPKAFMAAYRAELFDGAEMPSYAQAIIKDLDILAERQAAAQPDLGFPLSYRLVLMPSYNAENILTLKKRIDWNYAENTETRNSLVCLDRKNAQRLELSQVFTPGYEADLSKLISATLELTYSVSAGNKLSDIGFFSDSVPPTALFGLSENGLEFYYPRGQVAAASLGDISVYIPYSRLLDALLPNKQFVPQ
jgi:hypothetical protein